MKVLGTVLKVRQNYSALVPHITALEGIAQSDADGAVREQAKVLAAVIKIQERRSTSSK